MGVWFLNRSKYELVEIEKILRKISWYIDENARKHWKNETCLLLLLINDAVAWYFILEMYFVYINLLYLILGNFTPHRTQCKATSREYPLYSIYKFKTNNTQWNRTSCIVVMAKNWQFALNMPLKDIDSYFDSHYQRCSHNVYDIWF